MVYRVQRYPVWGAIARINDREIIATYPAPSGATFATMYFGPQAVGATHGQPVEQVRRNRAVWRRRPTRKKR